MNTFKSENHKTTRIFFLLLIFLVFPIALAFNVDIAIPITDSFHEGEYLGNFYSIKNYYISGLNFPILIHGAMDYIPALVASQILDGQHIIIWTRFFNVLSVAICWLVWLDLSRFTLKENEDKYAWNFFFIFIFFWMANSAGNDPVLKQQAFLGTRDLFLILSIWCGIKALGSVRLGFINPFIIMSGVFSAFCLYWSYDRGLIGAIWIAALFLTFVIKGHFRAATFIIIGYVATLFLISKIGLFGSFFENFNNIIYWTKNAGEVWFIPFKSKLPPLLGALAMVFFATIVISNSIFCIVNKTAKKFAPAIIGVIFIQLVFFSKLYRLPAFPTTYYYIWPSILLLILTPPKSFYISAVNSALEKIFNDATTINNKIKTGEKLFLTGVLSLTLILISNSLVTNAQKIRQLVKKSDNELINKVHYIGAGLGNYDYSCIFQWSNEGIFSFVLKKPFCSKYTYAVYISHEDEDKALVDLRNNPPRLIIYDSPYWSMSIFSRHMRDRLPKIDAFIRENYEFNTTQNGYIFATLK